MIHRLLADSVLVVHGLFIAFVALGALLVLWRRRLAWLHVPAVLWGVGITLSGGICPLTPLENHLRMLGGQQGYSGGFIEHYLTSAIYPDGLTRRSQILLGLLAAVWNLVLYAIAFRRR